MKYLPYLFGGAIALFTGFSLPAIAVALALLVGAVVWKKITDDEWIEF